MNVPKQVVPPRVLGEDGESVLLTEAINNHLEHHQLVSRGTHKQQEISILGDCAIEAVEYLCKWFRDNSNVEVCQANDQSVAGKARLIVHSAHQRNTPSFHLAGWGVFEFVKYLQLQGHDVKKVMPHVTTLDTDFAGGSPNVWRPILNELGWAMASESSLQKRILTYGSASEILYEFLDSELRLVDDSMSSILDRILRSQHLKLTEQVLCQLPRSVSSVFENGEAVSTFLARRVTDRLRLGDGSVIQNRIAQKTRDKMGAFLQGDLESKKCIENSLIQPNVGQLAAHWSWLLLCDPAWRPATVKACVVTGADLFRANWPGFPDTSSSPSVQLSRCGSDAGLYRKVAI